VRVAAPRAQRTIVCSRRSSNCGGRPLKLTVRSRMEEFGFSHCIRVRARRLRTYRALINSFIPVVASLILLNRAFGPLPQSAWILSLPWGVYLTSYFVLSGGFLYGIIKCPSCDVRFASRFPPGWVPRRCQNCGFDIYTLHHAPSNQRLERP
jgi:hypothetical protein